MCIVSLRRLAAPVLLAACALWAACCAPFAGSACAQEPASPTLYAPQMPADGGAFRIGYLEGGPFEQYQAILKATVAALAKLGWLQPVEYPEFEDPANATAVWNFLASNVRSDFIEFPADACYSGEWAGEASRKAVQQELLRRLINAKDLDLVLAMGTFAGQDLANSAHGVPTLVMGALDPVGENIVRSADDSGHDHVVARVDPGQFQRQVRMFHDAVGFKRMGLAYQDTTRGRAYAALDDVRQAALRLGVELVTCNTSFGTDVDESVASLARCHEELAPKVDAVYLTDNDYLLPEHLPKVLAPLMAARIPTFSMRGEEDVRHGAMLSVSQSVVAYEGMYFAQIIAQILRGALPRSLPQRFEPPDRLALNLETAAMVGYDPPAAVLLIADTVVEPGDEPGAARP